LLSLESFGLVWRGKGNYKESQESGFFDGTSNSQHVHFIEEDEMKRMGIMILAIGLCLFAQVAQADWTVARRLTVMSGDSRTPAIAIDSSGNLHIVWHDDTPGNYEIYYKKGT
jgi:hypothetical protein